VTVDSVHVLGARAKVASRQLATSSASQRNSAIRAAADLLASEAHAVLDANEHDLEQAAKDVLGPTAMDRLRLTPARLESMSASLQAIADLTDPLGELAGGWVQPNGLRVSRVRVPLGVVGIIYENRPNVTSDAAGLCLKAGNSVLLRGSSSAQRSNAAIVGVLRKALDKAGLPEDAAVLVDDPTHEAAVEFMRLRGIIDCLIPRGGPALIASLLENATVPYVLDGDGNCHVYVDANADLNMALAIVTNAKMQRPGVCNAAETLLVHAAVADAFLPALREAMEGVEWVGDERVRVIVPEAGVATDEDFATEFLALKMSVAVVDGIEAAIEHIARYSSGHSEAIITNDLPTAERFVQEVDAAAVLVNASTRFVDGGELGLGAEVGISTQKLHARGPMGVRDLTCVKWVIHGQGHVR
jgi:glutamate-5-semialdehyde dehydrogenase